MKRSAAAKENLRTLAGSHGTASGWSLLLVLFLGVVMQSSLAAVDASPPSAPTGLTAQAGGNSEVPLTWTASPGATSYLIFRSTTQNDLGAHPVTSDVTGTSYTVTQLKNDTTYYFKVKAVGPGGTSGFCQEVATTTAITKQLLLNGPYTLAPKNAPDLRLGTGISLEGFGIALQPGEKALPGQEPLDPGAGGVVVGKESSLVTAQWTLTSLGKATYRLSPVSSPTQALNARGSLAVNGTLLETAEYRALASQQWVLTPASGGYRLMPVQTPGLALSFSKTTDSSEVTLHIPDGLSAQVWNILPVSESAPDPGTGYVPPGYKLVFSDEFNDRVIDTTKWETLAPYSQPHLNDEIECYQPEAVTLANGLCTLRAEELATTCGAKYPWRSGAITSRATFTRGYYEARIKMPQGPGLWPAFWLTSSKRWPPEWDILEIPNTVGTLYQYMHPVKGAKQTWVTGLEGSDSIYTTGEGMPNPYSGFVIYGCEVTPQGIKLWVNGRLTGQWEVSSDTDDPMWVSLELAVGGKWPGPPDATTHLYPDMVIDYVRVYQ